jgi:hypothetical protein
MKQRYRQGWGSLVKSVYQSKNPDKVADTESALTIYKQSAFSLFHTLPCVASPEEQPTESILTNTVLDEETFDTVAQTAVQRQQFSGEP